jgi:hypothetical protein
VLQPVLEASRSVNGRKANKLMWVLVLEVLAVRYRGIGGAVHPVELVKPFDVEL